MNDQQDHHDAQIDPVTFAPPATDAWVFVQNSKPLFVVESAADFLFAEKVMDAAGGCQNYLLECQGVLGDMAFVTYQDSDSWLQVSISTTPTSKPITYCVPVIRFAGDVPYPY